MLRLPADEDFNNVILRGARRRNADLDIVRVQDVAGLSGADDSTVLERSTPRANRFSCFSRSPKQALACSLGLMDENSTTRSNSALSPGLNPLERPAYYMVRLGTYSIK